MKPLYLLNSLILFFAVAAGAGEPKQPMSSGAFQVATHEAEARSRAKLLHELVHGTLQIMHRDFFDDDESHSIPSASLEDVFHEMQRSFGVEMKWLVVNTDVVNVDHRAETTFDQQAVKALAAGKPFAEQASAERYRFAGPIRLGSQCLKCHVKRRTDNDDRTAGLVITMPLAKNQNREK